MLCVTIEGVDAFVRENILNLVAGSVIVAGIVSSNAEKLARGWLSNFQTKRTLCIP